MSQENRLVYIVDDDEAVRDSIRVLLHSHNIETRGCRSADEFLLANSTDMGCLVLDLHMPGTSGLDLLRLLRALGLPVPIIAISGRLDATLDAEVRAAGVTAMLSKPFDDEALLAVVQAAKIPITATSANLSGESECTTALAARDQLQGRISIIVDGGTSPRDVASTIIDLTDEEARWRIMREGAIPAQEISEFFAQG